MSSVVPIVVSLGGALGACARFVVDGELKLRWPTRWPLSTFVINVVGSFILGWTYASVTDSSALAFIATGFCGGFTTFSTASVESVALLRERRISLALSYIIATVGATLFACWAGSHLV